MATPLHFAALAKNYNNCKMLLKFNANPNMKDSIGNTPMHFAVQSKALSVVRILDQFDGDARMKNNEGTTPIDFVLTEDIRDIKLHFMSQQKYRGVSF
jgi:ankyrin repeat protein